MFRIFLVVLWIGFGGCPSRAQDDAPLLGDSITSLDGVVTVPLIPHHVQQRRRLEQGLVDESILQESIPEYPPRRYARDIMDEEGEPRNLRDADQVAELFQGFGTHYVDLWCGTPPQRQTVIVDTGSPVTAFPCSKCLNCGVPTHHIDTLYYEQCSSSFKKLGCDDCLFGECNWWHKHECSMVVRYAEWSSWRAYEAQDSCYIGGLHTKGFDTDKTTPGTSPLDPAKAADMRVDLKFGCQTRISGLFRTQLADGIMGMDQASSALWQQMYKAKTIPNQAFSLCFRRSYKASRKGSEAGAMSLGGTNPQLHKTPMVYSAGGRGRGYYRIRIRKAYLREGNSGDSAANPKKARIVETDADEKILNGKSIIVDSGSTDTYFTSKFGPAFNQAFEELTGKKYTTKLQKLTKEEVEGFPTILFQLYGDVGRNKAIVDGSKHGAQVTGLAGELDPAHPYDVILAIPPSHYFAYDSVSDRYAARFFADSGYMSVLGANSLMGHEVLFDNDNHVIGWAESDCDYAAMTKDVYPSNLPDEPEYPTCIVNAIARTRKPICVSWTCQLFIAVLMIAGVCYLCKKIKKRRSAARNTEEYEKISASELEMQTPPSELSVEAPYRDEDEAGDSLRVGRESSDINGEGELS